MILKDATPLDCVDFTMSAANTMNVCRNPSKTSSSSDLFNTNNHSNCCSDSSITNLSGIVPMEQQQERVIDNVIMFESPVKRKCIMKNFRKPRFSHWKSYWLQLIGGNILIYYPIKTIMFNAK